MERSLYIFSNGRFQRRGNTLYFEGEKGNRYIPVESIRDIFVFGEIDFNKKFLEFLSQHEILLHYFNHYGYYMGTIYPREHYNSGHMILRQAAAYLDTTLRRELAGRFVEGAYQNIRRVLRYYRNRDHPIEPHIQAVEASAQEIKEAQDIPALMAAEGHMRDRYYSAWDTIIADPDFAFESRSRRPPRNRLNALISFGNSFLYTAILSEIYKTHLDPRIGFLHATNFRRFTLNLDVAEVFKPIVVDRAIFTLVGRKVIQADSFVFSDEGVVMTPTALQAFVEELERRMQTTIEHKRLKRKVTYRRLIRMELYKLEKHLMGEEEYKPFVSDW